MYAASQHTIKQVKYSPMNSPDAPSHTLRTVFQDVLV